MIGRTSTLVSGAGNFETSSRASFRSLASIIVNPPRPSLVSANGPSSPKYFSLGTRSQLQTNHERPVQAHSLVPATDLPAPLRRFVLAWGVMIVGLVGFWCCRPWLGTSAFNYGQLAVLVADLEDRLAALPAGAGMGAVHASAVSGVLCLVIGMQPRQFLVGERTAAGAPIPTFVGIVSTLSPARCCSGSCRDSCQSGTPWAFRLLDRDCWASSFLFLFARLDFHALVFRAMGFAVEKLWDCPIAATTLGDFWGRRWNRIVPGFLREVVFLPVSRRAGARVALLAVFLYSGLYHELLSFMARSGYGGPALLLAAMPRCAIENTRRMRRLLRGRLWLARAWTFAVIVLPVGLFLHPGLVHGYLVPMLVAGGVPGLER